MKVAPTGLGHPIVVTSELLAHIRDLGSPVARISGVDRMFAIELTRNTRTGTIETAQQEEFVRGRSVTVSKSAQDE